MGSRPPSYSLLSMQQYMTGIGAPAWHRMTPPWGHFPPLCPLEHLLCALTSPIQTVCPFSFSSVPACLECIPFGVFLYIPIVPRMPLGRR